MTAQTFVAMVRTADLYRTEFRIATQAELMINDRVRSPHVRSVYTEFGQAGTRRGVGPANEFSASSLATLAVMRRRPASCEFRP
jgi:hypothetical protein